MKFNILTLFPDMYPGPINFSLSGKALKKKKFSIVTHNIRDYSKNNNNSVDDNPFGGGAGMILKADVMHEALINVKKKISNKKPKIIFLSPSGKKLTQKLVKKISKNKELIIICGRYEGVDSRFLQYNEIEEISVGDYVLSGGELASFILIDACVRLIPEVLGNKKSLIDESFENFLLEYPQYTKPSIWKNIEVPKVLLSGNHELISKWRKEKAMFKTKTIRPDLWKLFKNTKEEK